MVNQPKPIVVPTLTKEQAVRALKDQQRSLIAVIDSVKRKRWRPSEKAMTVADYRNRLAAIAMAIEVLSK